MGNTQHTQAEVLDVLRKKMRGADDDKYECIELLCGIGPAFTTHTPQPPLCHTQFCGAGHRSAGWFWYTLWCCRAFHGGRHGMHRHFVGTNALYTIALAISTAENGGIRNGSEQMVCISLVSTLLFV